MSQKSSVPQAISFVSQVLKRDSVGHVKGQYDVNDEDQARLRRAEAPLRFGVRDDPAQSLPTAKKFLSPVERARWRALN